MASIAEKRRIFREMHDSGCFVIPNPFDVGSARWLQGRGFRALATTSSGAAWSLGHADGGVPLDAMLAHIRTLVEATDVPINADFLNGFADEPEGVAANVRKCIATGVAGLSIEDQTTDPTNPLYEFPLAVDRVRAARAAIDAEGSDVLLVARSEVLLTAHSKPLEEAIRRLKAFSAAGADCLYAPGLTSLSDIVAVVQAVAPKPVNVLAREGWKLTVQHLAEVGVRRISIGGLLALAAWSGFERAAEGLLEQGSMVGFAGAAASLELNRFFAADSARRGLRA